MTSTVVLVRTHSPGNLGACARACRCFGAELLLVDPRAGRDHLNARAFASGAEGLLDAAEVVAGLELLPGRADRLVALTAARGRAARGFPPAATITEVAALPGRLALLFGPERSGLTSSELRLCDATLTLPTAPDFPTLSLPQAVAAALALLAAAPPREPAAVAATNLETARLFETLRAALAEAGWAGPGRNPETLFEIESLLRRARPTSREVTLLLGALAVLRR